MPALDRVVNALSANELIGYGSGCQEVINKYFCQREVERRGSGVASPGLEIFFRKYTTFLSEVSYALNGL
jgi:hypothetical protein